MPLLLTSKNTADAEKGLKEEGMRVWATFLGKISHTGCQMKTTRSRRAAPALGTSRGAQRGGGFDSAALIAARTQVCLVTHSARCGLWRRQFQRARRPPTLIGSSLTCPAAGPGSGCSCLGRGPNAQRRGSPSAARGPGVAASATRSDTSPPDPRGRSLSLSQQPHRSRRCPASPEGSWC